MTKTSSTQAVRDYLLGLQQTIIQALNACEQEAGGTQTCLQEPWHKTAHEPLQGDGITCILEDGAVFERAGCGFSHVQGAALPSSATQKRPELAGAAFEAQGVSLVFHPRNPYVPTVHMNVRMITAFPVKGAAVSWFGGGMDLTPYYGFEEDAVHFHQVCRASVQPFGPERYARYKQWCDEYFFLKHRNEQRGIGGIFYDDVAELGFDGGFAMMQSVGSHFLDAYWPIVARRKDTPYSQAQRDFQSYRRGRYVEFNLVFDRGTHFGLQSGGRTESILLSMPPQANWAYQKTFATGTPEAALTEQFLIRRDWLAGL